MMFGSSFSGLSGGILVGFHLHWIFCTMFMFGLVAALIWLARFATKQQVKSTVWTTLLVGGIGMILTAGFAFNGMRTMMEGFWERNGADDDSSSIESEDYDRYRGMMDWYYDEKTNTTDTTTPTTDATTVQQ